MSPEEVVAELRPIRLPESIATFGPLDALGAFAWGVLAAMLLMLVLRPLFARRARPVETARAEIARLATLEAGQRIHGLARLIDSLDPDRRARPDGLTQALYDPSAVIDPALLETAALEAARSARRRPR